MRIGILGLGSMGQPMARRLAQAGFSVIGFNRTRSRAEALAHQIARQEPPLPVPR
jgi:3-hydroxyisobutyrate dehydrogenase-like beta-hydroxyacid dehydrogenase